MAAGTSPTDGQGRASVVARLGMREGSQPIEAAVAMGAGMATDICRTKESP